MRRAAAVTCGILAAWCAGIAAAEPEFRLVAVDASDAPRIRAVVDTRGEAAASGLPATGFQLVEDGARTVTADRTIAFRETGLPLSIVVAVDMSQSMKGDPLAAIRTGIAQLVSRKRPEDRVAVLSFADEIRWETTWSAPAGDVRAAFERLEVRGNRTRLYDAIWESMDELGARAENDPAFPERRLILVISDGHDEGSGNTLQQISERLRTSPVRLDAVGLARSPRWLENLQSLVDAGFGRYRSTSSAPGLTTLLEQGIDGILNAPVLEFTSTAAHADGSTHRLGVHHAASNWTTDLAVTLPARPGTGVPTTWAAGIAAVVAIAGIGTFAWLKGRGRKSPGPVVSASRPLPLSVSAALPVDLGPSTPPASVTEPHPSSPAAAAATARIERARARTERDPVRTPTALAPQDRSAGSVVALAFTSGPYAGQRFTLGEATFWIGSNPNNQLCLSADAAVSGHHACITREGQFYRLHDNGSLNQTWLNGRSISDPALLRPGDRIRIGASECTFVL